MSVIIPAVKAAPPATFIFLHGLGDTGHGWAPAMRMLQHALPTVKFVLPHAPQTNVTLNGGLLMPAWYDLASLDGDRGSDDAQGISKSVQAVAALVEAEKRAGAEKVVLGGFSQGGVIALACGLSAADVQLDGVVALSGYLPRCVQLDGRKDLPVFMAHGRDDHIVQFKWGQESASRIKASGFTNVHFHPYSGLQHDASDQELDDMVTFIRGLLYKQGDGTREL